MALKRHSTHVPNFFCLWFISWLKNQYIFEFSVLLDSIWYSDISCFSWYSNASKLPRLRLVECQKYEGYSLFCSFYWYYCNFTNKIDFFHSLFWIHFIWKSAEKIRKNNKSAHRGLYLLYYSTDYSYVLVSLRYYPFYYLLRIKISLFASEQEMEKNQILFEFISPNILIRK